MEAAIAYVSFIIIFSICLYCGVRLVEGGHYGWAWIPFLIAACLRVKTD